MRHDEYFFIWSRNCVLHKDSMAIACYNYHIVIVHIVFSPVKVGSVKIKRFNTGSKLLLGKTAMPCYIFSHTHGQSTPVQGYCKLGSLLSSAAASAMFDVSANIWFAISLSMVCALYVLIGTFRGKLLD